MMELSRTLSPSCYADQKIFLALISRYEIAKHKLRYFYYTRFNKN
jgi:hypothetical protein